MEIDCWTNTFSATWDDEAKRWTATLKIADGAERVVRPRHIVMATSVSGTPKMPEIPTLDRSRARSCTRAGFANGADWKGRNV